jgi:hypothetical protein
LHEYSTLSFSLCVCVIDFSVLDFFYFLLGM